MRSVPDMWPVWTLGSTVLLPFQSRVWWSGIGGASFTRSVDNGSGAAVVDGSVPYGGSVKVSGDAFPFMTNQPNPWWDGSLSGAAPYLQFSVPQCFEGCDNKAGTGGVFGSVGPGARSVGRVAGYAAVGPSIGQGVRHSAGSAGYGAVVGDEFTKPMVGLSNNFGPSAAVGPSPHTAGHQFGSS